MIKFLRSALLLPIHSADVSPTLDTTNLMVFVTGRARHKQGKMISYMDQALIDQDKKNDYIEQLMNNALDSIQGMNHTI